MKEVAKAQVIQVVKKMINNDVENKEIGWQVEQTTHNSTITVADCAPIIQTISNGNDGQSRVGDRITPKRLTVKGVLACNPAYNPDTKPMLVRVIIAAQKNQKVSTLTPTNTDTNHLLLSADPGAPEVNFDGTRQALFYPVNSNKFRSYYDRIFTVCPTSAASGFPLANEVKRFTYRFKQMPTHFSFDQGSGDAVNNFAPFLAIGYAYADGSLPDTGIVTRIATSVYSQLSFEDA